MDVLARAHALEAAGRRVVHMEIGEPDFTAPPPVVEAGVRALRDGLTAYTATLGLPALREAIAAHYQRRFLQKIEPSRIAVTCGASGGLLCVAALYVNPGDEILVPDPGYPGYRHFVRAFEGVARALPVSAKENFQPTLATFIAERGGVLMVDEIYQGLVYGVEPVTALGLEGDVVIVNSFSKYFCMTGWRLGWVVLPPHAVRGFEKLGQHLFISAPSAAQHAAVAAFSSDSLKILEERRNEFARRRDFLLPALRSAGLKIPAEPHGAFYIYADCGSDSKSYCLNLLQEQGVAATPGIDFGSNETSRFVRFAYTRSMGELEEATARIGKYRA